MSGIEHAARLDQQQFYLLLGVRLVFDAPGDNEHFAGRQANRAVAEIDPQRTLDHKEGLIGVLVIMPNEIALQLHELELIVIHFRDNLRLPLLVEQSELPREINRLMVHAAKSRGYRVSVSSSTLKASSSCGEIATLSFSPVGSRETNHLL